MGRQLSSQLEQRWEPTGLQDCFPYDAIGEDDYFEVHLAQLGLESTDIDIVVLSHPHFDHAGNLQLFKAGGARVICHPALHRRCRGSCLDLHAVHGDLLMPLHAFRCA